MIFAIHDFARRGLSVVSSPLLRFLCSLMLNKSATPARFPLEGLASWKLPLLARRKLTVRRRGCPAFFTLSATFAGKGSLRSKVNSLLGRFGTVSQRRRPVRSCSINPHGRDTLPQGRTTTPQGFTTVPQRLTAVPPGFGMLPQGRATIPQALSTVPQGLTTVPHF